MVEVISRVSASRIATLDAAGVDLLIDWAAAEGWNPGLHDAAAFRVADPGGFLGLFLNGEMVSAISAVRYGQTFGFIGFYICRSDQRGKGFGKRIWDAGLQRLGRRTAGLDGLVAQQANYAAEGFVLAHRNIRYAGPAPAGATADPALIEFGPDSAAWLTELALDYDEGCFPARREAFARTWMEPPGRRAIAYVRDKMLRGYGVIRACRSGYKVGPLFADDAHIAYALFRALAAPHAGEPVALDTPEQNTAALKLAERYGLTPVFETARMYRGSIPPLPLERIFGITTFELG